MGKNNWVVCDNCLGRGTKRRKLSKKVRAKYASDLAVFETAEGNIIEAPIRPQGHLYFCSTCDGAGIVKAEKSLEADDKRFPHVAIIGAGISGVALAVACQHRGIPFTLYERDDNFEARSQGYGLTLQQANRAIKGLGIQHLDQGVVSTRHVAFTDAGDVIGEWGTRKWCADNINKVPKRSNIHIARQALREQMINLLVDSNKINWGHQLLDYKTNDDNSVELSFKVGDITKSCKTELLVGADGIRSAVRRLLIGEEIKPLRYLNCVVILGICPLENITIKDSPLLDGATIFQTANGKERIYVMPYTADSVMWQLSFPMAEVEAQALRTAGALALKEEAIRRMKWHEPIPQIIEATELHHISGYPVYDRDLLTTELAERNKPITLIGDAAHPMSPFKGQGANQAILDALALARAIYTKYQFPLISKAGIREDILTDFEADMLLRSNLKVKDSADAAILLHSDLFFEGGDQPRGRCRNNT
ncbi:FAD-dependent oxidoreductase [Sphingobacterium rhinopitheci]|uniref:FAD-dependent oxidoreductase n=1 Tax=Sphingobacterium rhinopitheci TaxID=2781960 RepID=UPI001F51E7B5|nr:NAD(P)/FAD-dependent oxidoreductase [Sphingobacterium rhinopitheci]MCI0921930.1 FAD-dependent monooxygenase [Sphingobacterium rhinopitheci]